MPRALVLLPADMRILTGRYGYTPEGFSHYAQHTPQILPQDPAFGHTPAASLHGPENWGLVCDAVAELQVHTRGKSAESCKLKPGV